jgi:hypothetical protein
MTTLLTVGNSEGSRRCDAKCYDAKGSICRCVCGGRNHGKGLDEALSNCREILGLPRGKGEAEALLLSKISDEARQLPLF